MEVTQRGGSLQFGDAIERPVWVAAQLHERVAGIQIPTATHPAFDWPARVENIRQVNNIVIIIIIKAKQLLKYLQQKDSVTNLWHKPKRVDEEPYCRNEEKEPKCVCIVWLQTININPLRCDSWQPNSHLISV